MREIKFRYTFQDGIGCNIQNKDFTLKEIEDRQQLFDCWKLLARRQFTGLKDKNGKEIYEGDILNKEYHNLTVSDGIGVVEMGQGNDSDGYHHGVWLGWKCGKSSLLDINGKAEVIGNIYENPDLLNKMEVN